MNRPLSDELSIVSLNEIYSFMLENVQAPCNSGKNVTEFFMVIFCPHKLPFLLCVLQSFKKKKFSALLCNLNIVSTLEKKSAWSRIYIETIFTLKLQVKF